MLIEIVVEFGGKCLNMAFFKSTMHLFMRFFYPRKVCKPLSVLLFSNNCLLQLPFCFFVILLLILFENFDDIFTLFLFFFS